MDGLLKNYFYSHNKVLLNSLNLLHDKIEATIWNIVKTIKQNGKILIMGNGGSAADAQHFAAELVGRFVLDRKAIAAISLCTDSSIITSVGNDYSFDYIFKRQIQSLANQNDLIIGISTSGNSENVCYGILESKRIGCTTIGLLGNNGGILKDKVDIALVVPSNKTYHIQEIHISIIHFVCKRVEEILYG